MITRDRLYPSILAPPCGLSESNTGPSPNRVRQCPRSGSACRFVAQSPCLLDRMTAGICNPPEHAKPPRPSSPRYGDSKRVTTPLLPGRLQTQSAPRFTNDAAETSRRRCRFFPHGGEDSNPSGLWPGSPSELPDTRAGPDLGSGRRFGVRGSESLVETWAGVNGELSLAGIVQRGRFCMKSV